MQRSLTSCPPMNLKYGPATTAPHGSLHSFESGQILNPYATYYRPPFAFSAFSYPLAQQLPLQVTCLRQSSGAGGQLDLPRSRPRRPECSRACPFSACLSPGSTFDDVLRWTIEATGYTPFWFGPDSRLGPAILTRFINSSPMLRMRNLPCTSHRTAAGSVDSFPVARVNRP